MFQECQESVSASAQVSQGSTEGTVVFLSREKHSFRVGTQKSQGSAEGDAVVLNLKRLSSRLRGPEELCLWSHRLAGRVVTERRQTCGRCVWRKMQRTGGVRDIWYGAGAPNCKNQRSPRIMLIQALTRGKTRREGESVARKRNGIKYNNKTDCSSYEWEGTDVRDNLSGR